MNIFKAIFNLFRRNLLLKIMAVIFALILWSYVIADTNPIRTTVVENIPVKIENLQELRNKGLVVSENLSKVLKSVTAQLEVRQKELSSVNTDNVTASIDLSKINEKGSAVVKVDVTTKYGSVVSKSPGSVKVTVDDYVKRTVPVVCKISGTANAEYYVSDPQITPNAIEISGAKVDVEKVSLAQCIVDLSSIKESINQSMNVTLLDQSGQPVSPDLYFESLPSAIVKINVLPKKTVSIDVMGSITNANKLKTGYEITGVQYDPKSLEIAGQIDTLKQIDKVLLENMDVTDASANLTFNVKPKQIDGIRFMSSNTIAVTVLISQIQDTRTIRNVPVRYINKNSGLIASISPKTVNVTLSGGGIDLQKLDRNNLNVYVDLKDLSKGTYTLPVSIDAVKNIDSKSVALSMDKVKVTLKSAGL